jgi:hypothetical protein
MKLTPSVSLALKLRRTCFAEILAGCAIRSPTCPPKLGERRRKGEAWWAHKGSNLGPLPCEGNALPLSYAPGRLMGRQKGAIYEVGGGGVKRGLGSS